MKRTILFLLCALLTLCVACIQIYPQLPESTPEPIAQATESAVPTQDVPVSDSTDAPEPTNAPEPTDAPEPTKDTSDLPMVYNVYKEVGFSVSEAEMFRYDLDGDGKEERISFRLDQEEDTTTILIDDEAVLFDISAMLDQVILIDLDPATPWINLLVEIDWGSDDYVTTELHLENGKPVKGVQTESVSVGEDGRLTLHLRTDFLGTRTVSCPCAGEQLLPQSAWCDAWTPSEEQLNNERDDLIEFGDLLHTVREIPCTINGKSAKLAKDSYFYMTRINLTEKLAEVRTLDGVTATIAYSFDDDTWPYLIDGVPQDKCFDNIQFSD